jgi:hypothetical protein
MNDPDTWCPDPAADKRARRTTRAAYTALGWVVLFFAFHVYWYLGGSLASPGELPPLMPGTHSAAAGSAHARVQLVAMIIEVPVDSAWPIGTWVCLAIARGWTEGRLARVTKALVWVGCVLLLLRGFSGILDDVTRATGLLPNGITGLSLKATTSTPTSAGPTGRSTPTSWPAGSSSGSSPLSTAAAEPIAKPQRFWPS